MCLRSGLASRKDSLLPPLLGEGRLVDFGSRCSHLRVSSANKLMHCDGIHVRSDGVEVNLDRIQPSTRKLMSQSFDRNRNRQANGSERKPLARRESCHASSDAICTQLLEAAVRCFSAQGLHTTTMDEIAQEASFSIGTLNRASNDNEELLHSFLDHSLAALIASCCALDADRDPLCQLRCVGQVIADLISRQQALKPVWIELLRHKTTRDRLSRLCAMACRHLSEDLQADAHDRKLDVISSELTVDTMLAILWGCLLSKADPDYSPSERFADAWCAFEAGLQVDT